MSEDPPPQLPAVADLDGWRYRVRARQVPRWITAMAGLASGWGLLALTVVLAVVPLAYPHVGWVVFGVIPALWLAPSLDLEGWGHDVEVFLGAYELRVSEGEGSTTRVPLVDVGRVRVLGGVQPTLEVFRAGGLPLLVPMQLEPVEHAAWLADALERAGRRARDQRGTSAEIPREILDARRGDRERSGARRT